VVLAMVVPRSDGVGLNCVAQFAVMPLEDELSSGPFELPVALTQSPRVKRALLQVYRI
jgi:hypothetical protein